MTATLLLDEAGRRRRVCAHCVYGLHDPEAPASAGLLCFNSDTRPGHLRHVDPHERCRNFRFRRAAILRLAPPKPPDDGVRYIALTKGKFALVSAIDYDDLNRYKWTASVTGRTCYARRQSRGVTILMHRQILNAPKGLFVDHFDGNGLNNWRPNLRLCTRRQNCHNSRGYGRSPYKGVSFSRAAGKWIATINSKGRHYYLGLFDTEIDAALAYDRKAVELFGKFAYLNFPEVIYADAPPPRA